MSFQVTLVPYAVRDARRRDAVAQLLSFSERGIGAVVHDPALHDPVAELRIGVFLPHRRRLGDVRIRVVHRHPAVRLQAAP